MDDLDQNTYTQIYLKVCLNTHEGGNYQDPYIGYTKEEADKIVAWHFCRFIDQNTPCVAVIHIPYGNKDHGDKNSGKTFKIIYWKIYEDRIRQFIDSTIYNFNNKIIVYPMIKIDDIDWHVTCTVL